jgi:hypothetical protein
MTKKEEKEITKKIYNTGQKILFSKYIDGQKYVVEARDKAEAEKKFEKLLKKVENNVNG